MGKLVKLGVEVEVCLDIGVELRIGCLEIGPWLEVEDSRLDVDAGTHSGTVSESRIGHR